MHLDDWCYMNDSAKAMKICTKMQMSGGKMKMDHLPHTMVAGTTTVVPQVMTVVPVQLQELSIGSWFHNEANKADQELHKVGHEASAEFHKIDWKDVGIDTWHGITACY